MPHHEHDAHPLVRLSQLEQLLAETSDVSQLKKMHDQLEAVHRLAKRLRLSLDDQNKIAELRIRTARKAGVILQKTVKRGGNYHGGSSRPLPKGISWNQSSRWQKLSRITEEQLARYLKSASEQELEVTVAGFLRASQSGAGMDPHFQSASHEWYTPRHVVEAVLEVLKEIDLDPCADPNKSIPAKKHYTEKDDGLTKPWVGRVYMNPPYGQTIGLWVETLIGSYEHGLVSEAIALVPSRTDTAWFQSLREYPRCFVRGRLRFSGSDNSAPFPSMCVYLGKAEKRFRNAFSGLGDTYSLLA